MLKSEGLLYKDELRQCPYLMDLAQCLSEGVSAAGTGAGLLFGVEDCPTFQDIQHHCDN